MSTSRRRRPRRSAAPNQRDLDARLYLARANRSAVAVAIGKAFAAGADIDDLVVLLLDTRDPIARELTAAILDRTSDLDLDAEERRVLTRAEIPTGLAVVPLLVASMLFAETHPNVAGGLRRLAAAPGRVRVVVVGAGGATLVHSEIEAVGACGEG